MSESLLQHFRKNKGLTEDAVFPFGKYKGDKIGDVLDEDPSYISWWAENVKEHPLHKDIVMAAEHEARLQDEPFNFDDSWGCR